MQQSIYLNKIIAFLVFIQYFMYFLYILTLNYTFLGSFWLIGLIILIYQLFKGVYYKFFIFIIGIFLLFFIFSLFSPQEPIYIDIYNLFYGILSLSSAYIIYKNQNTLKYVKFLFWAYLLFISYFITQYGINDPDLYNNIFMKASRNYVSAILLFILILLYLVSNKENRNINIIYPLLTFLVCVILYGRTGIAISLLILLFSIYNLNKSQWLKIVLTIAIISNVIIFFSDIIKIAETKTSFSFGIESERFDMLNEYFLGLSNKPINILFGLDSKICCYHINRFEGNPHNSFILGHIRYGIFHTIISLLILIYVLYHRKFMYSFFIIIIYFRASLDTFLLFTPYDIVLYYLLYSLFNEVRNKRKS